MPVLGADGACRALVETDCGNGGRHPIWDNGACRARVQSDCDGGVVPVVGITGFHRGDTQTGNGSILRLTDGSGVAKGDANDPSTWTTNSTAWQDDWQGFTGYNDNNFTWVVAELGSPTGVLDKMHLWNVQERGALNRGTATFDIYYATDPTTPPPATSSTVTPYDFNSGGWALLSGGNSLAQGTQINDAGEHFDISGASGARYIGLHLTSNHGGTRTGLAELAVTKSACPVLTETQACNTHACKKTNSCNTSTACRDEAITLGYKLGGAGYSFEGKYETSGCYAYEKNATSKYKGIAYYGTKNENTNMWLTDLKSPKVRIKC